VLVKSAIVISGIQQQK